MAVSGQIVYLTEVPDAGLNGFLFVFGNEEKADKQRYDIQDEGKIQNILIAHGIDAVAVSVRYEASCMVYNIGCDLIACKSGESPGGQAESVYPAYGLHSEMIGQKRRNIAEAAAVAGIDYEQKGNDKKSIAVADSIRKNRQSGKYNGQYENHFINGISVLHMIGPG